MKKTFMVATALTAAALITYFLIGKNNGDKKMTLNVAFPYAKPVTIYEPTRIYYAPEYIFLENVFSPLIELHPKTGEPVPSVAEKFEWVGDELHFHIRDDLKTVDGKAITAEDAAFSLKRLLVKSGNTHGNFHDLMCINSTLKTVEDDCPGIRTKDNILILAPGKKKTFLLPMVATLDFAIIPKSSVDPKTLDIVDYRNTSGPYYVESDDGKGNITLKANAAHFHHKATMPQTLNLVPAGIDGHKSSLELFEEGKVDYITTIDKLPAQDVIKFSQDNAGNLHTTMNIRTYVLTFTDKGLKKFSKEERLKIGMAFKAGFREYHKSSPGFTPTDQFFVPFGDGGLDDAREDKLIKEISEYETKDIIDTKLKISSIRIGKIDGLNEVLQKKFSKLNFYEGKMVPSFMKNPKDDEIPDAFVSGPDTGFLEDIGLISYSINAGFFGADKEKVRAWLKEYMETPDKEKRVSELKDLHERVLKEGILIPMVSSPYAAFTRKGWKIGISQIYANNPLWPIEKE